VFLDVPPAMYGGLAFGGNVLCNITGVDLWGGFELSPQVITTGFGYAVPPMMALLFILEDEVVKTWGPARAIRDVEDEELMDFFVGMSPWQFPFVVAAGAVAEELFFRVGVQGGLAHSLQASNKGVTDTAVGLAAVTGVIPLFVPFAQVFAAALTAALTGSMYYIISSPKDPKYVVAPVVQGHNNRRDIKQRVGAWYERRQQKKIYSPLMEALLAMYLGFEWVHTGNILAPMITHTLYSIVIVGNGLRRIHDNREKLRQRVNKIAGQKLASIGVQELGSESQIKG
jgi:membrane protease YdiL (CAAX protease family)